MGFATRLRKALQPLNRQTRELDYLNEATSLVDLERRQREIDNGRFHGRRSFRPR